MRLQHILERIILVCLYAAVFFIPLWFLPFTLDVLELNKQTLLVLLSMVALLAWIGRAIRTSTFTLTRCWVHIVVALFAFGYLVSSATSVDRYLSIVGNFGQMQWAFVSIAAFAVFYLIAVNIIKSTARLYHFLLTFLASSIVVGAIGLLHAFGVFPLRAILESSATKAFNTIGTMNSLAVFMAIPVVLAASLLVLGCKEDACILGRRDKSAGSFAAAALVWTALFVGVAVAIVTDFWVPWAAILFGIILVLVVSLVRTKTVRHPITLIVPAILLVLSLGLLIWPSPLKTGLPGEVAPSAPHSWDIAQKVLRDHPFLGTGPGTWMYDYSMYRNASVNLSPFWSTKFERGYSNLFTMFPTVGLIGTAFWLILLLSAVVKSALHLIRERDDIIWQAYLTVFTAWATVVFIGFFYNYNFSHLFAFWLFLALLASLVEAGSFRWTGKGSPLMTSLLSVVFLVVSVCAVAVTWLAGQRLVADAKYSSAVLAFRSGQPLQGVIDTLHSASSLNRLNDAYPRNLSQAYVVRANQILQSPTSDKDRLVNTHVSGAIESAKRAADLAPANVDNWSNLAVIYQAIAPFTRGADEFAIKNYEEALKRDPTNPVFSTEIAKLYIMRADAYRTLLSSKDTKVRTDAENSIKEELDKAMNHLNKAIQHKGDYAAAHYNLGILYERQGRLPDAILKLKQVLGVTPRDIGVGFQLSILYYRNGEKENARDILEQIIELDPAYSNGRWYLAAMYEEIGRYDDAITQLKALKDLHPDNAAVTQRLNEVLKARSQKSKPRSVPLPEPIR